MSKLLLQGGRIIDKAGDRYADVLIDSDGRIEQIGEGLEANKILDVRGKIISSGFVDLNAFMAKIEKSNQRPLFLEQEVPLKVDIQP